LVECEFPPALAQSGTAAVIYDETEGLSFFGGFGEFERAFTEPTLLDQWHYRQRVFDYLDDDSVSPLPFRRMADRDPTRASEVLRWVLGHKSFDWQRGSASATYAASCAETPCSLNANQSAAVSHRGDAFAQSMSSRVIPP
jgi:hypothetical protein